MQNYNRKSVFVTLFISFIIILMLPITVGFWLYDKMESIIKDNANRSNIAMLKQAGNAIDSEIYRVNQLAAQISFNPKLQFILSQIHSEDDDIIKYYNFMKDIKNYNISNPFIHDYYVYLPDKDTIVSPKVKTNSRIFYDYIYGYENINYDAWKKAIQSTNKVQTYIPSTTIFEGISFSPEKIITYLQTLPYGETKNPRGYLAILINEQMIKETLHNLEWANQGDIYILDKENNKIMTTAKEDAFFNTLDENFTGTHGVLEDKIDHEELIVSYVVSNKTKWKYISVVPKSVVMAKVNTVKALAISLLIFCLVGGLITSYYLAYRHYVPVKELVSSIVNKMNRNGRLPFNEYHIIRETLNKSWDSEMKLRNKLIEHTPQIKANFLTRLINGFVDQTTITSESLAFMNISIASENFIVFVIDVEECGRFVYEDNEKQWAIIRFIISNISEELANKNHNGFIIELDQKRVGVILNFTLNEFPMDYIGKMVFEIKEIVEERFGIIISIGIGNQHKGFGNIVTSYREALQALNYRMIKGNSRIISFNETKEAEHHYYYPEGIEAQLMNFIKIADFENAEKILDNIFEENFESRNISFQIGKCLFFNIMSTHLKILNDINLKYDDVIFSGEENPVTQLLKCQTGEEMHYKIKSIYKRLCNHIKDNRPSQSERLIHNITQYIQKHYADNMLSLSSIAEEMNITPQYLSSFFKKQKGENITDHIAKIRLEYAKAMLIDEELTITEIAKRIGYSNDVGFIRLFKKYEGITPGSYRTSFKDDVASN
ncbi:helix-turn-helix domain-containing protein [Lederbergia wuyishanensis]|uniref:AraC-like DNA-binding protein/uncharacterized protein YneF (UPF0154 family) n=1 Tax=Lederbergia wuyishanensis TaxID=1347903 RepID=A0ABU0D1V2_9BACI|nr:AraC family transcriptional regulator [Lederbergia wuyishanensis]MCJ8006974.1 AraC family transcriptional regulator [Lederbergia wuyishanensis]MDQ0342358.1 AraC-like DNA-binding protein/uncharacterized protein YneF (UPF0154 family) [Lederbergia wuyishanensis]